MMAVLSYQRGGHISSLVACPGARLDGDLPQGVVQHLSLDCEWLCNVSHPKGSSVLESACFEVLSEYWWAHLVPAKHAIANSGRDAGLQVHVRRLPSIAEDTHWRELSSVHCCEEAPPCDSYAFRGGSVGDKTPRAMS